MNIFELDYRINTISTTRYAIISRRSVDVKVYRESEFEWIALYVDSTVSGIGTNPVLEEYIDIDLVTAQCILFDVLQRYPEK